MGVPKAQYETVIAQLKKEQDRFNQLKFKFDIEVKSVTDKEMAISELHDQIKELKKEIGSK